MSTNNKQETIWVNGQEVVGTVHTWQPATFGNAFLVEVNGVFHRAFRDEDDGMLVSRNNAVAKTLYDAAYELMFTKFGESLTA